VEASAEGDRWQASASAATAGLSDAGGFRIPLGGPDAALSSAAAAPEAGPAGPGPGGSGLPEQVTLHDWTADAGHRRLGGHAAAATATLALSTSGPPRSLETPPSALIPSWQQPLTPLPSTQPASHDAHGHDPGWAGSSAAGAAEHPSPSRPVVRDRELSLGGALPFATASATAPLAGAPPSYLAAFPALPSLPTPSMEPPPTAASSAQGPPPLPPPGLAGSATGASSSSHALDSLLALPPLPSGRPPLPPAPADPAAPSFLPRSSHTTAPSYPAFAASPGLMPPPDSPAEAAAPPATTASFLESYLDDLLSSMAAPPLRKEAPPPRGGASAASLGGVADDPDDGPASPRCSHGGAAADAAAAQPPSRAAHGEGEGLAAPARDPVAHTSISGGAPATAVGVSVPHSMGHSRRPSNESVLSHAT
jgi:hypothetical protein